MYIYTAYNLGIHSEFPLPELLQSQSLCDVIIRSGKLEDITSSNGGDFCLVDVKGICSFLVRKGCEIVLDLADGVDFATVRPILLGPVMCILLRQRGLVVLHASSVAINGVAIAFMGYSGWGKSTLAEFFHAQGYSLLTDDVMALQLNNDIPYVIPSYPQIKLWPDSATSIGHAPGSLPLLNTQTQKLIHRLENGFLQSPLPLKKIYVLDRGDHPKILNLPPQESFVELVRHSRVMNLLDAADFMKEHMSQCSRLVNMIKICRFQRQRSWKELPSLLNLVLEDMALSISRNKTVVI